MHSVVVFGDVRQHALLGTSEQDAIAPLYGGAYFMAAAIRAALARANQMNTAPEIFCFEDPKTTVDLVASNESMLGPGSMVFWDLLPTTLQDDTATCFRLVRRAERGNVPFPLLSPKLREKLAKGGFEQGGEEANREVPDIVVFDDLGLQFRKEKIEPDVCFDLGDNCSEGFKRLCGEMAGGKSRAEHYRAALNLLAARIRFGASQCSARKHADSLEPVIVASVSNGVPELKGESAGIWRLLHEDPEIRRRTIVLLDADELRRLPLLISTGLSWERTAQDTIVELSRSVRMREFLKFGHLVIRYGVTGALHISQRSSGDWSFTLYFDPDRDDTAWTDPQRDRLVLGTSSVFAATIVEFLTRICNQRSGSPLLPDLDIELGGAIRVAIPRCQRLVVQGYGEVPDDFKKLSNQHWLGPSIFESLLLAEMPIATFIPDIHVPPVRLRNWSILSQSAQIRVGDVANKIVRHGAIVALNHREVDLEVFWKTCWDLLRPKADGWITHALASDKVIVPAERVEHELRDAAILLLKDASRQVGTTLRERVLGQVSSTGGSELLSAIGKKIHDALTSAKTKTDAWASLGSFLDELVHHQADDLDDRPIASPVVRLGKRQDADHDRRLMVVDRREIEGIRAIQRLMDSHLQLARQDKTARPLSIAVFGPPGSGKSTAVKRIVEMLDKEKASATTSCAKTLSGMAEAGANDRRTAGSKGLFKGKRWSASLSAAVRATIPTSIRSCGAA